MKIIFLLIFIIINSLSLLSQQSDYKQKYIVNKDIIWCIEITKDYVLDDYMKAEQTRSNRVYTLKQISRKDWLSDDELPLTLNEMLTSAAFKNKIKIYSDSCLKHEIDTSYIKNSPVYIKSNVNEGNLSSVNINFDSLHEYRLRYIMYYDNKKANWGIEVLAMAPLYNIYNEKGDFMSKRALFWMKVNNGKADLNSKDIIWAKRISDRDELIYTWSNKFHNPNPFISVIKNVTDNHLSNFIDRIENDSTLKIYDYGEVNSLTVKTLVSSKEKQLISLDRKKKILYSIDTVQLEGKSYIVTTRVNPYDFRELRLVHDWFWDDKKKQLNIWLERVGLMLTITDDMGNYMYKKADFYRNNED